MHEILHNYGLLLKGVDAWFARCKAAAGGQIACKNGCSGCCRGLFDITLLDAFYLKSGFNRLDGETKRMVLEKAGERLAWLKRLWPEFDHPFILNLRPEEEWEALMPEDDETPCPLLSKEGTCLVYEHRPMTCRLNGIPLVDLSGELFFDEWCSMNFTERSPLEIEGLRWGFRRLFRDELLLFRELTHKLLNRYLNELDTFIPTALLIDFEGFDWRGWWESAAKTVDASSPEVY